MQSVFYKTQVKNDIEMLFEHFKKYNMRFTKNELNLMRYAMEDLLNGDDVPNDKDKFEIHVSNILTKIDWRLSKLG